MNHYQIINLITELSPLCLFFVSYKLYGIMVATIALVIITIVCMLIRYYYTKKISKLTIITTVIIAIFGTLTILSNNTNFIKIKPTIVNLVFAVILLFGIIKQRPYMKNVLGSAIVLSDEAWIKLARRFMWLCIAIALLNEITWRLCSENAWVLFKSFGISRISLVFIICQVPFIKKSMLFAKK